MFPSEPSALSYAQERLWVLEQIEAAGGLAVQYADYALWQRGWLSGEVLERQVGYWRARLKDAPAALELPTDRARPSVQSHRGAVHGFRVSAELGAGLKDLARREGATSAPPIYNQAHEYMDYDMCGIVGFSDMVKFSPADPDTLEKMLGAVKHRGPDETGVFVSGATALGVGRLSIVDPATGSQPISNEDGSIVLICNGEIFNYRELRRTLQERGHVFRSQTDVEVILHLYEEVGLSLTDKLNGQFAFALFDQRRELVCIARDHVGIAPLFYALVGGVLIFASEIKAILEHPLATKQIDPRGIDQVLCFPGLISPQTIFKEIYSLKPGNRLVLSRQGARIEQFWDLDYPEIDQMIYSNDQDYYVEGLYERLMDATKRRMDARPLGVYLSGGLDSSLIAALMRQIAPSETIHSFSMTFSDREICERHHQRTMVHAVSAQHREISFDEINLGDSLVDAVYHAECPLKETFNVCSLALSRAAHEKGLKVVLGGEGADELFAGYPGYRFDQFKARSATQCRSGVGELKTRLALWGDPNVFYEREYHGFGQTRKNLYSSCLQARFTEVDSLGRRLVDPAKVKNRHVLHQRSYLDFKLRLADHLLGDHSDRMCFANAIEGRYPFLDKEVIEFVTRMPPNLKLHELNEKYIIKKLGNRLLPASIVSREKFGFRAPGSQRLVKQNLEFINDILNPQTIKRQGFFNPDQVGQLWARYLRPGFSIHPFIDDDILLLIVTFGVLLLVFDMPER
jgi:asparagine synthase (glutamine-hydrolysing)